jgi:hypothetical protein
MIWYEVAKVPIPSDQYGCVKSVSSFVLTLTTACDQCSSVFVSLRLKHQLPQGQNLSYCTKLCSFMLPLLAHDPAAVHCVVCFGVFPLSESHLRPLPYSLQWTEHTAVYLFKMTTQWTTIFWRGEGEEEILCINPTAVTHLIGSRTHDLPACSMVP